MNEDTTGTRAKARATVLDYYDALRDGEPLAPFFADDESVVKFGISERLVGGHAVATGLGEQTASTSAWAVESRSLRVTERDDHAWFSDDVFLSWSGESIRYEFDTRWSGTLERRDEDGHLGTDGAWQFVGMHVSTAEDT